MESKFKHALVLIDGSALLYRSYYGLRPLHRTDGISTQATYGFCRAIKKIIDDFDPKEMVVVWDSKGKTFRHDMYPDYKATRKKPPSDLFVQKEQIQKFLRSIELTQLEKPSFEADDIIAALVKKYASSVIVIVSPDKDLYQLLNEHVVIFDIFKKEIIDATTFTHQQGFAPTKLPFFHALLGDASDNIPGVTGIGKKGAKELVISFESLQDLYSNLQHVEKKRLRIRLEEYKEDAFLSQKLFELKCFAITLPEKERIFDNNNWHNAIPFFKEYEFASLLRDSQKKKQELFAIAEKEAKPISKEKRWSHTVVQTESSLYELVEHIKKKKFFALDTQTTGIIPLVDTLVGISIATENSHGYYIAVGHNDKTDAQLSLKIVLEALRPMLQSSCIKKTLHNTKFDQLVFCKVGIELKGIVYDSLLAANLLRNEWSKIGLKELSVQYLGQSMHTFSQVLGKKKTFADIAIDKAAEYAVLDAIQTFRLHKVLKEKLSKEKKLQAIFNNLEMPLSQILFKMERTGIVLDRQRLQEVGGKIKHELICIKAKIEAALSYKRKKSDEEINLNSPKQLEVLLFDDLKLPVVKKSSKGSRSTDHEVLKILGSMHPIPNMIIHYRELYKLLSTYTDSLVEQVNPDTGRIHTCYGQTLVVTGRLSSAHPNLQNIPASSSYGLAIRSAFIASRNKVFLSADYSQIELRILAHLSKDTTLINVFKRNQDIHTQTAMQLFDKEVHEVTHDQRQAGKRVNFSIMYGMTPYGLSHELTIKPKQAKEYIEKYFQRYPRVAQWMDETVECAKKVGYVQTCMGRRRYIAGLRESNRNIYQAARRIAVNTPVQGTQAELIKKAMIVLDAVFTKKKLNVQILLQIHDELVFEVACEHVERVKKIIKSTMQGIVSWEVPLNVTIQSGKNWADITK